ncbi:MAG: AraC family transcriptional regulator, partial [bacterium]|nr:AraC family transcriptional regulator [bacterium]
MPEQWNDYPEYRDPRHEDILLPSEGLPCRVFYNGSPNGLSVDPHWHEAIELLYTAEGTAQQMINGSTFTIRPGDVTVIRPLDVHATSAATGASISILVLQFDLSSLNDARTDMTAAPDMPEDAKDSLITGLPGQRIREYMEAILNESRADKPAKLIFKGYIYFILNELSQLYPAWDRAALRYGNLHNNLRGLSRVLAAINSMPQSPPTLPEAAALAGMSASYFSLFFKRKSGKRFIDYIHEVRLRRVACLLAETDIPIGDIAAQAGFNSLNFFNKVFRRYYGMTPLQY